MNTPNPDSTQGSWPIRWLQSLLGIILRLAIIVLVVLAAMWLHAAKQPSQPNVVSLGPAPCPPWRCPWCWF